MIQKHSGTLPYATAATKAHTSNKNSSNSNSRTLERNEFSESNEYHSNNNQNLKYRNREDYKVRENNNNNHHNNHIQNSIHEASRFISENSQANNPSTNTNPNNHHHHQINYDVVNNPLQMNEKDSNLGGNFEPIYNYEEPEYTKLFQEVFSLIHTVIPDNERAD